MTPGKLNDDFKLEARLDYRARLSRTIEGKEKKWISSYRSSSPRQLS